MRFSSTLCLAVQLSTPVFAQFAVKVEAIMVNVLVVDQFNKPILGLEKEDFRVYEDGLEQEIKNFFPVDAPFSVGLVLDTSHSAVGKLPIIQNAAIHFLDELHPDDEVMVISFDDEVYLDSDFTRNKAEAERAVKITRTGKSTELHEAVYLALEQFQNEPHRKVMILFTDGVDTGHGKTSLGETIDLAEESEVTIYTIFFDTKEDVIRQVLNPQVHPGGGGTPGTIPGKQPVPPIMRPAPMPGPLPAPGPRDRREREDIIREIEMQYSKAKKYLAELAERTGGIRVDVSGDLTNLRDAFTQIAAEMRSLYTLTYSPAQKNEKSRFRQIEVTVEVPDARARTRMGYHR